MIARNEKFTKLRNIKKYIFFNKIDVIVEIKWHNFGVEIRKIKSSDREKIKHLRQAVPSSLNKPSFQTLEKHRCDKLRRKFMMLRKLENKFKEN